MSKNKAELKSYLETSDTPTQTQFALLVEEVFANNYGNSKLGREGSLSYNTIGDWTVRNGGTYVVNSGSVDITTAAQTQSGIQQSFFLKDNTRYKVIFKAQLISGTAKVLCFGFPAAEYEHFKFKPEGTEKTFEGEFQISDYSGGANLVVGTLDAFSSGITVRISEVQLYELPNGKEIYGHLDDLTRKNIAVSDYTIDSPSKTFDIATYSSTAWYNASSGAFSAWGSEIGSPQNFKYISFKIKPHTTAIENVRVVIRNTDADGHILVDKRFSVHTRVGEENLLTLYVGEVANSADDDLYLQFACDAPTGYYGTRGEGPYVAALGVFKSSDNDIEILPTNNISGANEPSIIYCEFGNNINVIPEPILFQANTESFHSWFAQLAKIEYGDTAQAVIAMIGDSWTFRDNITKTLLSRLQTAYGNAGAGFVGGSLGNQSGSADVTTFTKSGGWVETDEAADTKAIDLAELTATAANETLTLTADNTEGFVIHYYQQVGGGSFRYRINGGSWTNVDTAGADGHQTVGIDGLVLGSNTIEIESLDTDPIQIMGIDCQNTQAGVRLHSLGNGGSRVADWVNANEASFQSQLQELNPHLVMIMLGTNDMRNDDTVEEFYDDHKTLIARIQAALPYAQIVLVSPGDNNVTGQVFSMLDYNNQLMNLALRDGYGFISGYHHFGAFVANPDYDGSNSRDLYGMYDTLDPSFHLSDRGETRFGLLLYRYLKLL